MRYKSVEMDYFNSLLAKGRWDALANIDRVTIYVPNITANWNETGISIEDMNPEQVMIMSMAADSIVGAYTVDEEDIQTITIEVMGGVLEFCKMAV